jgi:endoglucanase
VLDGHLDEVGFMVRAITDDGMLKFLALGGWWAHVLLGQRVEVVTERARVPGVIGSKPPHFLSKNERRSLLELDDMYIDVGAGSAKEAAVLGIQIGDPVVPQGTFQELGTGDILSSKAFDNRVGIGLLCETLHALRDASHPNTVVAVGAVQEEIGCRGAGTASELARPDVALILEGSPADDIPGCKERQTALGKGPQVRLYDPTAISNRNLVRFVRKVAAEAAIPIQPAVRQTGGTDAKAIHLHGSGVPTVVIGVPARYIHSHVSLIHWRDYVATRDLLLELVLRMDAGTVEGFTDYSNSP